MGRTATRSFETIATYLREFADGPQTTTQIVNGLAVIPSLPSLAQSTVNRCVASPSIAFYGIHPVSVSGSSRPYYGYSEALSVAAREKAAQEYANETVRNLVTGTMEDKEAEAVRQLGATGFKSALEQTVAIEEELAALKEKKEYFCRDDYERRMLRSFRKARKVFNNEEALNLALSHSMATSVFVEGILPSLSDPNKPSVNKVLMGAQLLLSDFGSSKKNG